jgi:hypothetical protein
MKILNLYSGIERKTNFNMKLSFYRNKADKAFQKWFCAKHPKSEISGQPTQVGHHFFPKSTASALRYCEDNMVALVQGEHFRHHNGDPRIHAQILRQRGEEWYKELLKEKNKIIKPSIKYYKSIIKTYENV